jgi:hypothetical protein
MAAKVIFLRAVGLALLAIVGLSPFAARAVESEFSGVTDYFFDPNPQEIVPKLHNWEIKLSKADSENGVYEIVQITKALDPDPKTPAITTNVLVEPRLIARTQDGQGIVAFKLYVGDKEPHPNMGRQGNSGEPIIFSGNGTANGSSGWIVFPGSKIEPVTLARKGTPLTDGKLNLIQFIVTNARGKKFQADVILRRK